MDIFLITVQAISDSRFWLMPLLLICILVMIIKDLKRIIKEVTTNE